MLFEACFFKLPSISFQTASYSDHDFDFLEAMHPKYCFYIKLEASSVPRTYDSLPHSLRAHSGVGKSIIFIFLDEGRDIIHGRFLDIFTKSFNCDTIFLVKCQCWNINPFSSNRSALYHMI